MTPPDRPPVAVGSTTPFLLMAMRALSDTQQFDPYGGYAEICWLPVLGPNALTLYRHLARVAEQLDEPAGPMWYHVVADALGLDSTAALPAAFDRLQRVRLTFVFPTLVLVRTRLPKLSDAHLDRLPTEARLFHDLEVA